MKNTTTTRKNAPAKSRTHAQAKSHTPVDPIAEMQSQIAMLTQAVATIAHALQGHTTAAPTPAPAQAKSRTRVAKSPKGRVRDEAKIAAHNARKQAFADARDAWAQRSWDECLKLAAAEIRKNRKANARNANIADANSNRVWLSSASNQGLMAARKNAGVTYADMEATLTKLAK